MKPAVAVAGGAKSEMAELWLDVLQLHCKHWGYSNPAMGLLSPVSWSKYIKIVPRCGKTWSLGLFSAKNHTIFLGHLMFLQLRHVVCLGPPSWRERWSSSECESPASKPWSGIRSFQFNNNWGERWTHIPSSMILRPSISSAGFLMQYSRNMFIQIGLSHSGDPRGHSSHAKPAVVHPMCDSQDVESCCSTHGFWWDMFS